MKMTAPVESMSDEDLRREVTMLRDEERAWRKLHRRVPFDQNKMRRITEIALEQGNRWARSEGWE